MLRTRLRRRVPAGRERLVEDGGGHPAPAGADLENEREADEDAAAPPARLRQQVARLTGAEQGVARGRSAAERRGHAAALSALEQNGDDQDQRVDDEQPEQELVNHVAFRSLCA